MFCTPQGTLVPQMLVAKGPGATLMLADIVQCIITLLHTASELSGSGCSVKTQKQKSSELSVGELSMKRSQPVHGCDFVTIGCNSH